MKHYQLLKPVIKRWHLMGAYVLMAYILASILVGGSTLVGTMTDNLFMGEPVVLKEAVVPFIQLTLFGAVVAFFMKYIQMSMSLSIQTEVKSTLVKKISGLEFRYFDATGTGSIMNKLIGDIFQMEVLFSEVIPQFVINLVIICTISVHIFMMNSGLMLVMMTSYPILLWIAHVISKKMGELSGNRRSLYDELENVALDTYNGIIVGRTYNLEEPIKKRINHIVDKILSNEYIRTIVNSFTMVSGSLTRWVPLIICYLYAFYEVMAGRLTIGTFLVFVVLLDRVLNPLSEMPGLLNGLREMWVSFQRLEAIMEQEDEPTGTGTYTTLVGYQRAEKKVKKASDQQPLIQLRDLTFSYDGEVNLFEGLDLDIHEGTQVALVGSSGSGKTTIFKILCGFYHHEGGDYKLHGHSVDQWAIKELRNQYALVSQNAYLFPGTIADNVAYGREEADREAVVKACKQANIHDFIIGLPQGYDTIVGERGGKLSGGQRQRIAIARALLKDAPILLLDEPTSAVDEETEQLIKEALIRIAKNRTVITIAHRLSTIEHADEIVVFDKGCIVEKGSQATLLAKRGTYYSLYEKEVEANV